MKDKISVIVPCYNVEKYVIRCFNSIFNQSYGFENLEVIFVDDLSTDNTLTILDSLQKRYPQNVILLKRNNKGMEGGARNLGIDVSSGKYITFVDADDYINPDMIELLHKKMEEDDYDVVQCFIREFSSEVPDISIVRCQDDENIDLNNIDCRKNILLKLTGNYYMCACAKLFSSVFIKNNQLRFVENMYYVDNHFSCLCILLASKYCVLGQELYYYFVNESGITRSSSSVEKIHDLVKAMDVLYDEIKERKLDETVGRECYAEIQVFIMWKKYIETLKRMEDLVQKEREYYKESVLRSQPDIINNPYLQTMTSEWIKKQIEYLKSGE